VPRGTPRAFPSLARESLVLRPEGRLNLTTATGVAHTHRLAVRRRGPSARLAGAPTRISRSSRVGPSGQLLTVGAREVAVKATFPLARRVCPASDGSNYLDGIWGDALGPWATRARLPTGSVGTATAGHGAHVRGLVPGAPPQAAGRPTPARCRANRHGSLLRRADVEARHAWPAARGRRPATSPASAATTWWWGRCCTSPSSWRSIRHTGSDPWFPGGHGRFRTSGLCRVNPGWPPHRTSQHPVLHHIPAGERRCQARRRGVPPGCAWCCFWRISGTPTVHSPEPVFGYATGRAGLGTGRPRPWPADRGAARPTHSGCGRC
jgi:hypothetical protein